MKQAGRRGFYRGTDKEGGVWEIPRHVDPRVDGTTLAADRPRIFETTDPLDSVPLEEFDRRLEAVVPADVIARIDQVIAAGKFLAGKGLADRPPLDEGEWRRGMILSWSHARDLDVVHDAIGHPRKLTNHHDVDELVLARHLKVRLQGADGWYKDYVNSLDDGAWVNVGFFNPNISASLYKWGDAKHGVQNAMEAHRLAAHHQGSDEAPLDWIERAINFVVHHIPREHWGIRHEPRGSYSELEDRLATDPAIKDAEIGKTIARDATQLYELLEGEGKVVPWGLLKVPGNPLTPSVIEHAYYVLLSSRNRRTLSNEVVADDDEDEAANPERLERARRIMSLVPEEIKRVRARGQIELARSYESFVNSDE